MKIIEDDECQYGAVHHVCTHVGGKWPTTKWRVCATSEHKLHLHLVPYFLSGDRACSPRGMQIRGMNNILYSEIKRIAPNPATFVIQMRVGAMDGSRSTCDNDYFTAGLFVLFVKFFVQLYFRPVLLNRRSRARVRFNSNTLNEYSYYNSSAIEFALYYTPSARSIVDTNFTKSKIWLFQNFVSLFSLDYLYMRLIGGKYWNLNELNWTNILSS